MKLATAPERYHTIPEIAEQLAVTARHVYNLIEIGALKAIDISALQTGTHRRRQLRVTATDFTTFLRARVAPQTHDPVARHHERLAARTAKRGRPSSPPSNDTGPHAA